MSPVSPLLQHGIVLTIRLWLSKRHVHIMCNHHSDSKCDFEGKYFLERSMWPSFLAQRKEEVNPVESNKDSEDEPEPKESKSTSELKGKSADSSDDSPVLALEPPAKH